MTDHSPFRLVLASASPYRKQQLAQLNIPFDVFKSHVDEEQQPNETAPDLALRLATAKAKAVQKKLGEEALIIGCDQTAECQSQILGKPGTRDKAIAQLLLSQQNQVIFHSGICLLNTKTGKILSDTVTTVVKFRPLSQSQIENYIDKDAPLDCAGSFKCEGLGISLFESIHSDDPSALIGLPLIRLNHMLLTMGLDTLL
ncbi:MAG: septum formation protein Maf [Alteromonadaceae bacterium]|nr:MAG: septum formation protein Maf [Alteromonadaceae bacterium]